MLKNAQTDPKGNLGQEPSTVVLYCIPTVILHLVISLVSTTGPTNPKARSLEPAAGNLTLPDLNPLPTLLNPKLYTYTPNSQTLKTLNPKG